MARKKRAPDSPEDREIVWALRFERTAALMNPDRYASSTVAVHSSLMLRIDEWVHEALSSGAFPADPLLQLEIYRQAADHLKSPHLSPSCGLTLRLLRGWVPMRVPDFGRLPAPGLVNFVEGRDHMSLDAGEFTAWLRTGLLCLARIIRNAAGPFVPNAFQTRILKALDGRALTKMGLAREVCGGEENGNLLYRPGGLKELRDRGLVGWKTKIGFYRPDAPPPGAIL